MESQYQPLPLFPNFQLKIPDNETQSSVSSPCFVLGNASLLFSRYVPSLAKKSLTIQMFPTDHIPRCIRQQNLIFLNCEIDRWNQLAYQFAHELCHFTIPVEVHPKLRWVEESICQAASIFFLFQLARLFAQNLDPYAPFFSSYAEQDARTATSFNWKDPAELSALEADPYLREKNSYVANHLLPIIWEAPRLWAAVPLLGSVRVVPSIQAGLDQWLRLTPSDLQPDLRRIIDVLV